MRSDIRGYLPFFAVVL